MRPMKRFFAILTLCLMAVLCLCVPAGAAESCSLTIQCGYESTPLTGAEFSLYRIGEVSLNGDIYLQNAFATYPVTAEGSNFSVFAQTLYGYACKDQLIPEHQLQTNEQGFAQHSGLAEGVYLVAGQPLTDGDTVYEFQPQLVFLPYENAREVILQVKCAARESSVAPVSLKVLKIWEDGENAQLRPESVTVYLLKNGELWDTVTLSGANSWRHTWSDLDADAQWQVAEEPVMDYFVAVSREGDTFTVTNTYDGPIPDPPTEEPDIPQTGMLLWPIPVLAAAGLGLVIAGIVLHRRARE